MINKERLELVGSRPVVIETDQVLEINEDYQPVTWHHHRSERVGILREQLNPQQIIILAKLAQRIESTPDVFKIEVRHITGFYEHDRYTACVRVTLLDRAEREHCLLFKETKKPGDFERWKASNNWIEEGDLPKMRAAEGEGPEERWEQWIRWNGYKFKAGPGKNQEC
ncbi:hypothetical protein M1116_04175 [Patescibacteria group bacterium]|nr:hypothetical protein [Patescibacteria group bacterium]